MQVSPVVHAALVAEGCGSFIRLSGIIQRAVLITKDKALSHLAELQVLSQESVSSELRKPLLY